MADDHSYHMTPQEFRHHGKQLVDWIADYWERVEELPVMSPVRSGEIRAQLPPGPPAEGEPMAAIMADFERIVMPGITHWQSPNFFAFFPANTSGPSVLGEMLSAALGVQGMLWATSPACTELESHVLDWLADMLDLPGRFRSCTRGGGVIQDSASSAAVCALLAARERVTQGQSNLTGANGRLVVYATSETHSSIEKAVGIAGLGRQMLRRIETDENLAMRPEALAAQLDADLEAGLEPCMVVCTVGTTSSNASDPLHEVGRICTARKVWMHVDAAMAGAAAICPEFRYLQRGLQLADSYCFNPHKWLFTNFDCDCFYVADRQALISALSILPEYLRNQASESGQVIDYRDWQIPLGRRFRALKLWMVIRHYGVEGLRAHLRRHVELARRFAEWVEADIDFEVAAPRPLNLVCFRHLGGDEVNRRLEARLNNSGKLYLTHTTLSGRYVLRLCVGQSWTEERHVRAAWELIRESASTLG